MNAPARIPPLGATSMNGIYTPDPSVPNSPTFTPSSPYLQTIQTLLPESVASDIMTGTSGSPTPSPQATTNQNTNAQQQSDNTPEAEYYSQLARELFWGNSEQSDDWEDVWNALRTMSART